LIIAIASSAVNSFAGEQKPDVKKPDFTPNDSAKKHPLIHDALRGKIKGRKTCCKRRFKRWAEKIACER